VQAPTPTALFGGTLLANVGEGELRTTANFTLTVTLTGDEWVDGLGVDAGVSDELLYNLVSTETSTTGWNSIVRGNLGVETLTIDRAVQTVRPYHRRRPRSSG